LIGEDVCKKDFVGLLKCLLLLSNSRHYRWGLCEENIWFGSIKHFRATFIKAQKCIVYIKLLYL